MLPKATHAGFEFSDFGSGLDSIMKRYFDIQVVKLLVFVNMVLTWLNAQGYLPFIQCYHLIL